MQSHSVHAVEGLDARVRALGQKATRFVTLRDQLAGNLASKEQEVVELGTQVEKLTKVLELFRVLMDLLVVKQVRSVESVVTEGLKTIFYDLDLSFEAEIGPKYNKIAVDFFIRHGSKDDLFSHRGKPLESFGGGPSSVASLALRILTVLRLKLWPMLVLDESLVAISDEYTDQTGQFLRALCSKLGVDLLLVTHKPAFLDHAHQSYRCTEEIGDDGTTRWLALRSIK
jgi:hypothetical protein